ncbi:MAG: DHHA1 domain-containing protein [Leptospirales bacterium]
MEKALPRLEIDGTPVTVFYHKNCSDGFGAAFSAWKSLNGRTKLNLIPVSYGDPLPVFPHGEIIYVVDFSFGPDSVIDLRKHNKRVIVLDHHKTAFERMAPRFFDDPDIYFDMDHSGAAISWAHFNPDIPVPNLIQMIEDKDLWKWNIPYSREINTALASYPFDLEMWNSFLKQMGTGPVTEDLPLVQEGKTILRYQRQIIQTAVRETLQKAVFPRGEEGLFINSPILNSEIGGYLRTEAPLVVIWSHRQDGRISYSLRSTPEGPDVTQIAEQFGGGGHARAAGFIVPQIVHRPI